MMHRRLTASFVLILSSCAGHGGDSQPITIARPAFGGEALFSGSIELRRGCIVTGGNRPATVLFDTDVTLTEDHASIRDGPDGPIIPFGKDVRAGSAFLRESGNGWSLIDIEAFFDVEIPSNCPTQNVVRLHDFKTE